jgi:mediator of RNA polymerase II transcription subunit 11
MEQLDKVEKEIVSCLQSAGQALAEISKDKPNQKQVDLLVTQFMTCLANIDSSLTDHIRYLNQASI